FSVTLHPMINRVVSKFTQSRLQVIVADDRPKHPLLGCSVNWSDLRFSSNVVHISIQAFDPGDLSSLWGVNGESSGLTFLLFKQRQDTVEARGSQHTPRHM